jgi:hypothetical protein
MLNPGIEIGMDCIKPSDDVRCQKLDFIVLKIKDKKVVQCVDTFPRDQTEITVRKTDPDPYTGWAQRVYPELQKVFKDQDQPMYVVLDFKCMTKDQRKCSKLYFIGWCPENANVRDKMLFATTFTQLASALNISIKLTAHTLQDIEYSELLNLSS